MRRDNDSSLSDRLLGRFETAFDEGFEEPLTIGGSKPLSRAAILREFELDTHLQASREWLDRLENESLRGDWAPLSIRESNTNRFYTLRDLIYSRRAILFVGAGLSAGCGKPTWSGFLEKVAARVPEKREKRNVRSFLRRQLFEEATDLIIQMIGEPQFQAQVEEVYGSAAEPSSVYRLLPHLADGPVITTNFDSLISVAFESCDSEFTDLLSGISGSSFHKSLAMGKRHLLRLHGSHSDPLSRILTRSEYDNAYGQQGVDLTKPLPTLLKRIFVGYSCLFLGCSLVADRTLEVLKRTVDEVGWPHLPNHYAIVEAPPSESKLLERERWLSGRKISAIWYEPGRHEVVDDLLLLGLEQAGTA